MFHSHCTPACRDFQCYSSDTDSCHSSFQFMFDHATDPCTLLGMKTDKYGISVRAWLPDATEAWLIDRKSQRRVAKLHADTFPGLFTVNLSRRKKMFDYVYEVNVNAKTFFREDPYRYGLALKAQLSRDFLTKPPCFYSQPGPQEMLLDGRQGTCFSICAPSARQVTLCSNFENYGYGCYPMRLNEHNGVWSLFMPGIDSNAVCTYRVKQKNGQTITVTDPHSLMTEETSFMRTHLTTLTTEQQVATPTIIFVLYAECLSHYFLPNEQLHEAFLSSLLQAGFTHLAIMTEAPS